MPLATDRTWIKTYGRLPWWRVRKIAPSAAAYTQNGQQGSLSPLKQPPALSLVREAVLTRVKALIAEHPNWSAEQIKEALKQQALGSLTADQKNTSTDRQYDWNEEDHPREDNGQFAPAGGNGSDNAKSEVSEAKTPPLDYKSTVGNDATVNAELVSKYRIKIVAPTTEVLAVQRALSHILSDRSLAEHLSGKTVELKSLPKVHGTMKSSLFISREDLAQKGPGFVAAIIRHELEHSILSKKGIPSSQQESRVRYTAGLWAAMKASTLSSKNPSDAAGLRKAAIEQGIKLRGFHDQKQIVQHYDWNEEEERAYQFAPSRDPTPYEKKVDFAAIQSQLDHLEIQSKERIRAMLLVARDKLLALISRKLHDHALTTKFVNDLELRGLGQLIPTLREIMRAVFRIGQQEAAQELKRSFANTEGLKDYQVRHTLEGLPPQKALEFFDAKATLWGADIRDPLLSDIKGVLYDAIKMGTPLRDVQSNLQDVFLPWLGDPDQQVNDQLLTPYRLETMIRTNTIEALNEGRKAQFEPEIASGFITGLQFSAILDARTTEVCKYLDKMAFQPSSSELDRLTPPRHYNCRSVLVPITRNDGPVQFITPAQVAKGIELSGKGFDEDSGDVHTLEFDPSEPRDEKGQWTSEECITL